MKHPYHAITQHIKQAMPKSLFGRALLILVLPTILLQILAITIFYERHWSSIRRHLSSSLAGEIAVVIDRAYTAPSGHRGEALESYADMMNMDIALLPLPLDTETDHHHKRFHLYVMELEKRINLPFMIRQLSEEEMIRTQVALPDQVVQVDVGIKRLESSTTYIFVTWVVGSAVLLLVIAIVFLRNQIRPISRLAEAAQRFGIGQDVGNFRPHGAEEVRSAGKAFMVMRSRITRQMATRTAMLTGISHDLRTPLTRMKLQLEMLGDGEETRSMRQDVQDMEYMLNEYLDFARGNDDTAPRETVNLAEWLRDLIQSYLVTGASISYSLPDTAALSIHPVQMKRALQNVIGNALKYGEQCHVTLEVNGAWCSIRVEDDGPGIPETAMEDVFRPFTRLDTSRNSDTGGVGLGLAIARDIVQVHGGHIRMNNRYDEQEQIVGLSVLILLPL